MILLELFWTFFKIGLFTIGGGYAMIPLIAQEAVAKGWMTEAMLVDFLAISESTPGPLAVNTATMVGFNQYGILGAAVSTIGVVLPSFIIILIISKFLANFTKNKFVKGALNGVKPVVVALIFSTAFSLIWTGAFGSDPWKVTAFDYKALIIMVIGFVMLRFKKTKNPILLIGCGAVLGLVLYGLLP